MNVYYVIIFNKVSYQDIINICKIIGMHNVGSKYSTYVTISNANEQQIAKLYKILKILDVDFDIAKHLNFDE